MSEQEAWIDNQGDVWRLGADGLMHTAETAPFLREHVEKKWGPLRLVGAVTADEPAAWYCPECGEPQYIGAPDDHCLACGGFDWLAERDRGWAS